MRKLMIGFLLLIYFSINLKADITPKWEWLTENVPWQPIDTEIGVIVAVDGDYIAMVSNNRYLYISTDMGKNWKYVFPKDDSTIYPTPIYIKGNTLYVQDFAINYFYITSDFGVTWDKKNTPYNCGPIQSIITDDKNIYIGASKTLLISSDSGNTWKVCQVYHDKINCDFGQTLSIYIQDSIIIAGGTAFLCKSTDYGNTWAIKGLMESIYPIIKMDSTLYLGISGGGKIYNSTDMGETWNLMNVDNISDCIIVDCGFWECVKRENNNNNTYLYYAKDYNTPPEKVNVPYNWVHIGTPLVKDGYLYLPGYLGVYRTKLTNCYPDTTNTTDVPEPQNPSTELTISPNPASDVLNINGNINNYPIKIYNIEGIKQIEAENTNDVDISKLPRGVYYIQIGNYFTKFVKI